MPSYSKQLFSIYKGKKKKTSWTENTALSMKLATVGPCFGHHRAKIYTWALEDTLAYLLSEERQYCGDAK